MDLEAEELVSALHSQAVPHPLLCTHHDGCDFFRIVPIQVKLEGHHLVVVGLQLALHHPVILVRDLQAAGPASAWEVPARPPGTHGTHVGDAQPGSGSAPQQLP